MQPILVVQTDARGLCGLRAPISVGIARWRGGEPHAAVVLKCTLGFERGGGSTIARVAEPEPVRGEAVSELDASELGYASDFVLSKPSCDVLLTGHAHAAEPAERIDIALAIGDVERRWVATAPPGSREQTIPLWPAYLLGPSGERAHPLGPQRPEREEQGEELEGFDLGRLQSAAPELRIDPPVADATLTLTGLSPRNESRTIALPGLAPRLFLDARAQRFEELAVRCDTLWIDTDYEKLILVWRAVLPPELALSHIEQLLVALDRPTSPRNLEQILRLAPRGSVSFAVEEMPIEVDPDELEMARWEVLEHPADPELDVETYATIAAELAEHKRPRADVLAAHDLDERSWLIEERAHIEQTATRVTQGDATATLELGAHFQAAQDAQASPIEPRSLEEYAALAVALADSQEPNDVLRGRNMGLGEWMRLDRHWKARAATDQAVAERLRDLLDQA